MHSRQDAPGGRRLRVLVVDDSAVVRQVVRGALEQLGGMEVVVAADPLFAREAMRGHRPDVILLDLEMPRMDGLTFLRAIMAEPQPVPVVVCSGHVADGSRVAMEALDAGAVGIVSKPAFALRSFLEGAGRALVDTLRVAASTRPRPRGAPTPVPHRSPGPAREPRAGACEVVVIGASTGGTDALSELFVALPADAPPIVIVQHIPGDFTRALAERLDGVSAIDVREATGGEELRPGLALLAPGGRHLVVERRGGRLVTAFRDDAAVSGHRPSATVLFHSAALAVGARAAGVLLTGMGDDGADGLLALRGAGAPTIVQDEASCVVFGMPKAALDRGAAAEVAGLSTIAERIAALGG